MASISLLIVWTKTGQHHISLLLIEDGAVAHIVATTSPVINREQRERLIVDQIMTRLRDTPDERFVELVEKARQRFNQLHENDVAMDMAEIGHSIWLFYFATSLRGLQYLHEIYSNDWLKYVMQEIFIDILLKTADAAVDFRVDSLEWDLSNYTDCLQQLYSLTNLPILAHVYGMAKHNHALVFKGNDVLLLPIDILPFELIEIILVQATGRL